MEKRFVIFPFGVIEGLLFVAVALLSSLLLAGPYYMFAIVPALIPLALYFFSRFPNIAYFIVVFMIPLGAFRALGGGDTKLLNISWLLGLFLMGFLFYKVIIGKEPVASLKSNLWPLIGIYFVVNIISAFMSSFPETSFDNIRLSVVAYIFVLLSVYFASSEKAYVRNIPLILIASITLNSFLGVIGNLFNIEMFAIEHAKFTRSRGGTIDPNNFSLMAIFSLPLIVNGLSFWKGRLIKVFLIGAFITNILGIVFTFSRGGAMMMFFVVGALFINYIRKLPSRKIGVAIAMIGLISSIVIAVIPPSFWERQQTLFAEKKDSSLGRRTSYIYVAADAIKENPILGSGPGSFRDIFSESDYAEMYHREGDTKRRFAHNTYLEVLVGTGIVGGAMFLWILQRAIRNFIEAMKNFDIAGRYEISAATKAYLFSFGTLLLYLMIFSEMYHKYFLLSLALSQAALNISRDKAVSGK
ncbi:MAG: O-antigen ligase family protein [Nitrospirae bacterium]|nr:O-antigen ligase family protein [Nitrospirota bacterium]